jgi:hypothetical protein
MKIKGYLFLLLLIPALSLFSQPPVSPQTKVPLLPILSNPAFKDGEELKYLIHYGIYYRWGSYHKPES